ncbi:hypothetical protein [Sphingosinithalassobacter portus]|uniref:hypothetical protein n=1 Tax=Stakelama portus TaxID=2676234 RepID=UPI000D6DFAB6|nr:hypothetical protein [Sphingosinithalassobacter portus]
MIPAGGALLLLVLSGPAAAQRLGGGHAPDISIVRILGALFVCLLLAGAVALVLKRGGGRIDLAAMRGLVSTKTVPQRIEIIETRRISQHADICVFRCDSREYLVLSSAREQRVLREAQIEVADEDGAQ